MSTATTPHPTSQGAHPRTTAVVFPGQGSQRPHMARAWRHDPAFERWAEADEVLGRDVTRLGLDAGADELREPVSCQVALFVHHAVLLQAWRRHGGAAGLAAGHSLGEYSALLAAGVFDFAGGLRLVAARAEATQVAAQRRPGGMAACLGADPEQVRQLAASCAVHVANDNATGQLVVAGDAAALDRFVEAAGKANTRVRRLEVGAAYHTPLMAPAAEIFAGVLERTQLHDARIPVVANVDARPHSSAQDWRSLLVHQLTQPVRWRETALALDAAADGIVELGASAVVAPMVKRTVPRLARRTVSEPDDLQVAP